MQTYCTPVAVVWYNWSVWAQSSGTWIVTFITLPVPSQ